MKVPNVSEITPLFAPADDGGGGRPISSLACARFPGGGDGDLIRGVRGGDAAGVLTGDTERRARRIADGMRSDGEGDLECGGDESIPNEGVLGMDSSAGDGVKRTGDMCNGELSFGGKGLTVLVGDGEWLLLGLI